MSLQQLRGSLVNLGSITGDKLAENTIVGSKLTSDAKQAVLSYKPIIIGVSTNGTAAPASGSATMTFVSLVGPSASGSDGVVVNGNESIISNANVEIFDGNGNEFVGSNGRDVWGRVVNISAPSSAGEYIVTVSLHDGLDQTEAEPGLYTWGASDPDLLDVIYPVRKNLFSMSETDLTKNTFRNVTAVERDIVTVNHLGILFGQAGINDTGSALDVAGTSYLTDAASLLSAVKLLDSRLATVSGSAGAGNTGTQDLYTKTGVNPNGVNLFSSMTVVASGDSLIAAVGKLDAGLNAEVARATAADAQLTSDLAAEIVRASGAEATLTSNLASEVARATAAEAGLAGGLSAEISRATGAESQLTSDLNVEVARATAVDAQIISDLLALGTQTTNRDNQLEADINTEIARATGAEAQLTSDLAAEIVRASGAEAALTSGLSTEVARATAAEDDLQSQINALASGASSDTAQVVSDLAAEVARATGAEAALTSNLAAEIVRASGAEAALTSNLSTEVARATAAEAALASNLATEVARATGAEAGLTSNLAAEIVRASGAEAGLTSNLAAEIVRASGAEQDLYAKAGVAVGSVNTFSSMTVVASGDSLAVAVGKLDSAVNVVSNNLSAHINDTMDPHGPTLTQTNLVIAASGLVASGAQVTVDGGAAVSLLSGASAVFAAGSVVELNGTTVIKANVTVADGVTIDGLDLSLHAHDGTAEGGAKLGAANVLFTSIAGLTAGSVAGALDQLKDLADEISTTGGANGLLKTDEFVVSAASATQASFQLTFAPKAGTDVRVWVGGLRVNRLKADGVSANWQVTGDLLQFLGSTAADLPNGEDPVSVDYQH